MSTFALKRFSKAETLRRISPDNLASLLKPFSRYLVGRGVSPAPHGDHELLDHRKLSEVFLTPDDKTPPDLIHMLYLVDEMATSDGMDACLREAKARELEIDFGEAPTPGDVVVRMWVKHPTHLERLHAEQTLDKLRSFDSYQSDSRPKLRPLTPRRTRDLEARIDTWLAEHHRGGGARVTSVDGSDGHWFLIRHGGPFQREESLNGSDTSVVCFRPVKYDIVHYLPATGELRVNARSKGERQLLRTAIGDILFGDPEAFPGTEKYTLDPLRELGSDALAPGLVEGIDEIVLREVQLYYPGDPHEVVIRKSDDLFRLWAKRDREFPEHGRIVRATFRVKFSDARTPRAVTIRPSNVIHCSRDGDAVLVERWLALRGFIRNAPSETQDPSVVHAVPALVGA